MGQSQVGTAAGSRPTAQEYIVASGSTNGQLIAVAATSSPGTLLHTVPHDMKGGYQRVMVWGCNIEASANRTITLQPGGTATKDQIIKTLGARRGLVLLTPDRGIKMYRGAELRAHATAANVVNVYLGMSEGADKEP